MSARGVGFGQEDIVGDHAVQDMEARSSRIFDEDGVFVVKGPLQLLGEVWLPGDKSISHRALLFAAIADGVSTIANLGTGADVAATRRLISALGIDVETGRKGSLSVMGVGFEGLIEPESVIDCANSGTTMRLGAGLVAGRPFLTVLDGDASLRRRPMMRVVAPLRMMGAEISGVDDDRYPPLEIRGRQLSGIRYRSDVASAQVKAALVLAALQAEGPSIIELPLMTRDHTERMLKAISCDLESDGYVVEVHPSQPVPFSMRVPGDLSSAAFLMAAATVCPGSEITIRSVSLNPTRAAVIDALTEMGADISVNQVGCELDEPVADIRVRHVDHLRSIEVSGERAVLLIDEIPVLACLAGTATGSSTFRDLSELRNKESDRIDALCTELTKAGIKVEVYADGFRVHGGRMQPSVFDSHADHRLALALAAISAGITGKSVIGGFTASEVSYPEFGRDLVRLSQSDDS